MKFTKNVILINLFSILLIFGIFEITLRILSNNTNIKTRSYQNNAIQKVVWAKEDDTLGWVFDPFYKKNPLIEEKDKIYDINKEGFRNSKDFSSLPIKNKKTRVLLLGDSFLFGVYLKEGETISDHLRKNISNQYEIINMSSPGWGLDQMFLAYEKYKNIIHPDIIIILYIDADMGRVFYGFRECEGLKKPRFEVRKNKLTLAAYTEKTPLENIVEKSHILNHFYRIFKFHESKKISETLFKKIFMDTQKSNILLAVIRLPLLDDIQHQTNYIRKMKISIHSFKDFFADLSVQYYELIDNINKLSPDEYSTFFGTQDYHFSNRGCLYVAKFIAEKILKSDSEINFIR